MRRIYRYWIVLLPVLIPTVLAVAAHGDSRAATVRDFGAAGDGKTDDTAAIQKAVDAGTGDVRLPRGAYRITRPIVIDLNKHGPVSFVGSGAARIIMAGPGPALKFIGTHQGTADPETVKPEVGLRQRMPTVDGLEIVGAHEEACGIEATGTMHMVITRVTVRESLHGVHLTVRDRNVIVSNCHLYKNRGVGLYLDQVSLHQTNVTGCHISYNAAGGVVVRGGSVFNVHVAGCDIEANRFNLLLENVASSGNGGEVAVTGCTLQHAGGPDSANIRLLGDKDRKTCYYVTIANNVISDTETNIDIKKGRGVSIIGNTLWLGYKYNLRVEDSSDIVVGPNNFCRNPRFKDEERADYGVLFRNCRDVSVTGLHLTKTLRTPAALVFEGCRRANVGGCTILDCAGGGILMSNVADSRVADCLIRNDLPDVKSWASIRMIGGRGNLIANNLLGGPVQAKPESTRSVGNVIQPPVTPAARSSCPQNKE